RLKKGFAMERISELRAILSNYFPWNKWRLDSFSRMLLALITARTVNLQRLATGFGTDTKITSRYRRLQRFFAEFNIDYTLIASLLADREFVGQVWFQWLIDSKIPFHIRIKENSRIVVFRGKGKTAQQLFNDVNPKHIIRVKLRKNKFSSNKSSG